MPTPATRKKAAQAVKPVNGVPNEAKRQSDVTSAFDNILSSIYTTEESLTQDVVTATQKLRNLSQEKDRIEQRNTGLATQMKRVEQALSAYGNIAFIDITDAQSRLLEHEHRKFISSCLKDVEKHTAQSVSSTKANARMKEIDAEIEEGKLYLNMLLGIQCVVNAGGLKRARKANAEIANGREASKRMKIEASEDPKI